MYSVNISIASDDVILQRSRATGEGYITRGPHGCLKANPFLNRHTLLGDQKLFSNVKTTQRVVLVKVALAHHVRVF